MDIAEEISRRAALAGLTAGAAAIGLSRGVKADAPEIVFGAPNSLTGGLAESGLFGVAGITIAVNKINAEGGIKSMGGAKIKLVVGDTSSENSAQAAGLTQRMIDQDKASVILGASNGAMTLAAQVICEKAQVPLITNSYPDALVERGMKYTFKTMPQGGAIWNYGMDTVYDMIKATRGTPPKNCVIIQSNDAVGLEVQKQLPEEAKKIGLPVLKSFGYQMGLIDPTTVVAPILQTKPELIFYGGFINDLILVINAIRSLGITAPIVNGGTFNFDSALNGLGKNTEHLMGVCTGTWDMPVPGVKDVIDAYRKLYPDKSPYPASDQLLVGYCNAIIMRDALEKAGTTDGPKLRDVLANTEFTNLPVAAEGGKVKFAPNGLNIYNNSVLAEWVDGKLHTIWPKRLQTVAPQI